MEIGCSYEDFLDSLSHCLVTYRYGDYSGEFICVYKDDCDKYGMLIHSYGSCSGCDEFYACYTNNELEDLHNKLCDNIQWFDNKDDLRTYIISKDWAATHSEYINGFAQVKQELLDFLS